MRKILFSLSLLAFTTTLFAQNCPPSSQAGVHIVQKGETLYRISKMYGTTVQNLLNINGRSLNQVLSVCTPLRVYGSSTTASTTTVSSPAPPTTTYYPPQNTGGGTYIPPTSTTTTTYSPPPPANTGTNTSSATNSTSSTDFTKGGRYSKPFDQYVKQEKGVHYAEENENMEGIAALYGYTAARFREFNGLPAGSEVYNGQVLRTTDCDCLNTVTDKEDERVEINKPTSTTGGYYLDGVWYDDDAPIVDSGDQTTTTTTSTDWTSTNPTTGTSPTSTTTSTTRPAPQSFNRNSASYLRSEESAMIDEINLIRSNPKGYIPYIQEYIKYLQNNGSFGNSIKTAVELIDELRTAQPLSTLQPKECLYNVAKRHGEDEKRMGTSSHQGSDGSWPWDRILKGCRDLQDGNENLVGGPEDIRRAVILLLVDDGIASRGHRKALLNPAWKYVACHKVGKVGSMPNSWIQNFAY